MNMLDHTGTYFHGSVGHVAPSMGRKSPGLFISIETNIWKSSIAVISVKLDQTVDHLVSALESTPMIPKVHEFRRCLPVRETMFNISEMVFDTMIHQYVGCLWSVWATAVHPPQLTPWCYIAVAQTGTSSWLQWCLTVLDMVNWIYSTCSIFTCSIPQIYWLWPSVFVHVMW